MSTYLPRTTLGKIYKYGYQSFTNRLKILILISFLFILLPRLTLYFLGMKMSASKVEALYQLQGMSPLNEFMLILEAYAQALLLPTLLTGVLNVLGVLALARTSIDYFESRPRPFFDIIRCSVAVMVRKSFGCIVVLLLITPVLTFFSPLRAVAISILVMLPVTLVAETTGGFRTTWNTLFLKYTRISHYSRWPAFLNVLAVSGLFLSVFFLLSIVFEKLNKADIIFGTTAGFLEKTIHIFGAAINSGWLFSNAIGVFWETAAVTLIIPFTAAIYHLSTDSIGSHHTTVV